MRKPHITKTYGPIHFEDLDSRRFEDLVRELIYDFRDWQSIEATGKGGSDDGVDIRAYERLPKGDIDEDEDGDLVYANPMNGNRWQIQCKRHAELGPQKILEIIGHDLSSADLPYGYILVASCNFSKKAYDTFRSALANKGVMEFYLWGKPELEMMLYLPRNDRILFTFFGISMATKGRRKTAEIKISVANKNKLFRILGSDQAVNGRLLVRDVNDSHYPYRHQYPDFQSFPRWGEYETSQYIVGGILVLVHEYLGYWDERTKTWDYTPAFDFVIQDDRLSGEADDPNYFPQPDKRVSEFWEGLPYKYQATFKIFGLLQFENMLLIDEKGDHLYQIPHIFMEFAQGTGPFGRYWNVMEQNNQSITISEDEHRRISIFPETFPEIRLGTVHKERKMILDPISLRALTYEHTNIYNLYYAEDAYDFLEKGDTIMVQDFVPKSRQNGIKITFKEKSSVDKMLEQTGDREYIVRELARQLGRNPEANEIITKLEFKKIFMTAFENEA